MVRMCRYGSPAAAPATAPPNCKAGIETTEAAPFGEHISPKRNQSWEIRKESTAARQCLTSLVPSQMRRSCSRLSTRLTFFFFFLAYQVTDHARERAFLYMPSFPQCNVCLGARMTVPVMEYQLFIIAPISSSIGLLIPPFPLSLFQ